MPQLTAQELAGRKAGETAETNGFGQQERPLRPAGLYRLKDDNGAVVDEIIVKVHPKFGDSQAAAAERVGYKFVRAAEPGEVKEIEVDAKYLATEGNHAEDAKGIQARMTLLEQESKKKDEQIDALLAQLNKGASDNQVAADSKEETKAEAISQTDQRTGTGEGEGESTPPADDELKAPKDEVKDKPFEKLNSTELRALAEAENITIPAEADTNAKVREVITKARAEKEGN